ncbi:MAG: dTMP kinase [Defluviitaleaceae bacterium]|nr:dTMP kinase [Defluviitaleaceae bacterium]
MIKKFITFEGLDGCGKSTQANLLKMHFENRGEETLFLREPGGTPLGELLRTSILKKNVEINPHAEALLFAASRIQLTEEIKKYYTKKTIICDRFLDSSLAYQCGGRGVSLEFLKKINTFANIEPNITFLIKVNPETSFKRVLAQGKIDRIESESLQFYEAVYEFYKKLAKDNENRIIVLDGHQKVEEIHKEILSYLRL